MIGPQVSCGIEEQRAYKHFDAWAADDTYFPADDDLAAMREATFQADCVWQDPPTRSWSDVRPEPWRLPNRHTVMQRALARRVKRRCQATRRLAIPFSRGAELPE